MQGRFEKVSSLIIPKAFALILTSTHILKTTLTSQGFPTQLQEEYYLLAQHFNNGTKHKGTLNPALENVD